MVGVDALLAMAGTGEKSKSVVSDVADEVQAISTSNRVIAIQP